MLRLVTIGLTVVIASAQESEPIANTCPSESVVLRARHQIDEELKKADDYYTSKAFQDNLLNARSKARNLPSSFTDNMLNVPVEVMNQRWMDAFNRVEDDARRFASLPPPGSLAPIILVSLSMPRETLTTLAADALKTGGAVYFRGLKNDDFRAMRRELTGLGEGFAIDPTLFERFEISEVPTFVLPLEPVPPCESNGCPATRFVKVRGNISLEAALEYLSINSQEPKTKTIAEAWLKKIRAPL